MCFIVSGGFTDCFIAETDIKVYKIGKRILFSPWFVSEYFNYVYFYSKKQLKNNLPIHAYSGTVINKGYHSYSLLNKKHVFNSRDFGLFIIPKGTKYYYNPIDKEYVSETILFKGKLRKKENKNGD